MNSGMLGLILAASGLHAAADDQSQVTFNRDVAPILHAHCTSCHTHDGPAPFELITYQSAKRHSKMIAQVTSRGIMPPWQVSHSDVPLRGARGLSDEQRRIIERWVAQGSERGEGFPPTLTVRDKNAWVRGQPDLILEMDEAWTIPADGPDVIRTFVLPFHIEYERFLEAVEFRAENLRPIHHATFMLDTSGTAKRLDDATPGAGYDGMGDIGFNTAGTCGAWSPGGGPVFEFGGGATRLVPRDGDFVVEMHLSPTGKQERIRASLAMYFGDQPTGDPPEQFALALTLASQQIDIAAGNAHDVVHDELTLPAAARLFGVLPHAHYVCQSVLVDAVIPGRESPLILLQIDDWDFNFMQVFRFEEPVELPVGATLRSTWTYNNSASNPQNPHDPPRRVLSGERATDEMASLIAYIGVECPDDAALIEQAHRNRQLQRLEEAKQFRARQSANPTAAPASSSQPAR